LYKAVSCTFLSGAEAGGWFGANDMLSELEDEKEAPMMNFSL